MDNAVRKGGLTAAALLATLALPPDAADAQITPPGFWQIPVALIPGMINANYLGSASFSVGTVALTGLPSGSTVIASITGCNDNVCSTTAANALTVTASGATCSTPSGAANVATAFPTLTSVCTGVGSGSQTFSFSWTNGLWYANLYVSAYSNANGAEGGNSATGSTSPATVGNSGTLSQGGGELAYSLVNWAGTNGNTAPAETQLNSSKEQYQITKGTSVTNSWTLTGPSAWTAIFVALKHK